MITRVLGLTLAVGAAATCGHNPEATRTETGGGPIIPARIADSHVELASFRKIDRRAPAVDPSASIKAALIGTVDKPGADLGSRMQVRELEIPTPPANGTATFNFAGTRRGWVARLPRGDVLPTPAFAGGKVFISGGFGSRRVFAFDAYDGEFVWALTAEDGGPSAAIVEDGKVVFNAESCKIFVADARTGKLLWKKWLGDPLMSVPVAAGGVVMTAFPHGGGHVFVGLALEDGKELWRLPVADDVIRTPQVHGDSVYFATMDGTAYRVRREDGKKIWEKNVGATSAMWVDGDRVLLSRKVKGKKIFEQPIALAIDSGKLVKQGPKRLAAYFTGTSRDRKLVHHQAGAWGKTRHPKHLGLTNVAAGWAFQGSSPVVAAGRSYLAIAGDIVATDLASGKRLWQRTYKQAGDAQAITPPAVVGSQLVFGTVDGHLYFADIDTGMAIRAYDVGEAIVSQPIVAQGWVYLTTAKGRLVALELADPMFDGWHMWGGNPTHTGLVAGAGKVDAGLLASLERPGRGVLEVAGSRGGPALPMVDSRVAVDISGTVARVELTQRFTNPKRGKDDKPIEAVYRFPLPGDAAVDHMEMRIGERVIRARIKEKKKAKKTYAKAKKAGKRAALLEQQRPDLFSQRVANIAPGETIEVTLGYVHQVEVDDGRYTFRFPMVASERAGDEKAAPAGDVALALAIDAGVPIAELASPTHEIASELRGRRASVKLTDKRADRDFELRYTLGAAVPTAAIHAHRDASGGYLGLMIQPPAAPTASQIGAREVIVALDTSASMAGRPIEQARAVATRLIGALRPGDRFNLFWRGVKLADAPLAATADNINRAVSKIRAIRAGGKAAMLPTLEAALGSPASSGSNRTRIVAAVTDGFIGNEADVLRSILGKLGSARFYPVGVGSAQNRLILERAAELGRGHLLSAPLSAKPADVAGELLARIDRPVFTDVEIDWGGLAITDVYPRRIPDLFAGRPLVVRGRFATGGAATVKIRGTVGGQRYERDLAVELPGKPVSANSAQRSLWARAAIRDRMNALYLRDDEALIKEVTELGLQNHLVTQWTSFVAVDDAVAAPAASAAPAPQAKVTVTPAAALPGDPEIRIPAPRDARAVTVVLPFGETLSASYDHEQSVWTARFLIPSDAGDGSYPIEVITTLADGKQTHDRVWYEVDSSAPLVKLAVVGDPRPGARITLRATQTLTAADRRRAHGQKLTDARIQLLSDAKRVSARGPGGEVIELEVAGPGVWEASYTVPATARGRLAFEVVVVDLAANIRKQPFAFEVER